MSHFKRSTARDFRIDGTTVNAILQGQAGDEVCVLNCIHHLMYCVQEDNNSSGGDSPKAKRLKLSIASDSLTD